MKLNKVEICMNAVVAIKETVKNIGMVCRNCENLVYVNEGNCGYCAVIDKDIDLDEDFCKDFRYRDDDACADFWKKCMKEWHENVG